MTHHVKGGVPKKRKTKANTHGKHRTHAPLAIRTRVFLAPQVLQESSSKSPQRRQEKAPMIFAAYAKIVGPKSQCGDDKGQFPEAIRRYKDLFFLHRS